MGLMELLSKFADLGKFKEPVRMIPVTSLFHASGIHPRFMPVRGEQHGDDGDNFSKLHPSMKSSISPLATKLRV
jgi:hypothetical protein